MSTAINQKTNVPVVRGYKIGGMTYIVKAVVKDGAKEDAATKIRRMIRNVRPRYFQEDPRHMAE